MTLEIFALVGAYGDSAGQDHMFTGLKADLEKIAKVLDQAADANRRIRAPRALAARFREAAGLTPPLIRLNKKECRQMVDAVEGVAEGKAKTLYVSRLSAQLGVQVCVYGGA